MGESELVRRVRVSGDMGALARLVQLHQGKVRAFLLRLTRGDHALADDLAQDTFMEAWKKIGQYRGDTSFAGWLLRIAWTRFLMHARAAKPADVLDERLPSDAPGEMGTIAHIDLERAMARIEPAERAALTLCFAMGYSHSEAADVLDMPLGTVKSHVSRGREKLRALLQGWSEP